jgi:hypothetical protein
MEMGACIAGSHLLNRIWTTITVNTKFIHMKYTNDNDERHWRNRYNQAPQGVRPTPKEIRQVFKVVFALIAIGFILLCAEGIFDFISKLFNF